MRAHLPDQWVGLEEERQRLADTAGGTKNASFDHDEVTAGGRWVGGEE